jgi:protein gp37
MEKTKIQWTDHTVNFWTGCKKVSDGCKFCYMYRDKERYGKDPTTVVKVRQETIDKTLREAKAGDKIFTCSWSDFFIEEADQWRAGAWDIIRENPQLNWQILTKRPERIMECLPEDWGDGWDHVWLGVSIESQKYIHRIVTLAKIPAKIRFISAEPLIGEVDLTKCKPEFVKFHWCIIGGESGNNNGKYRYRICDIKWFEKIIKDLQDMGIKLFVKQTGTYLAKYLKLKDRHGGEINDWPIGLQVREFPI